MCCAAGWIWLDFLDFSRGNAQFGSEVDSRFFALESLQKEACMSLAIGQPRREGDSNESKRVDRDPRSRMPSRCLTSGARRIASISPCERCRTSFVSVRFIGIASTLRLCSMSDGTRNSA